MPEPPQRPTLLTYLVTDGGCITPTHTRYKDVFEAVKDELLNGMKWSLTLMFTRNSSQVSVFGTFLHNFIYAPDVGSHLDVVLEHEAWSAAPLSMGVRLPL